MISVSEMARQCGLSRSRFHQLLSSGIFPSPLYDVQTRRPFYPPELQQLCLQVRRSHCGINGKPVLFYAKRVPAEAAKQRPKKVEAKSQYSVLADGLRALGLSVANSATVAAAVKQLYPSGIPDTEDGEVLRTIFLHLKRRDSNDNVGR